MIGSLLCLLAVLATPADETVGGKPYTKRATRDRTRDAMMELLRPTRADFGDWYVLAPFPYAGHGRDDLARFHEPERDLVRMVPGGRGPDLYATYAGKNGAQVTWKRLGRVRDRVVEELAVEELERRRDLPGTQQRERPQRSAHGDDRPACAVGSAGAAGAQHACEPRADDHVVAAVQARHRVAGAGEAGGFLETALQRLLCRIAPRSLRLSSCWNRLE